MLVPWGLTIGIAGGGVCCLSGAARRPDGLAGTLSALAIALMAAALIAMAWPWGMNVPVWPQVVAFALVGAWFLGVAATGEGRRGLNLHQALMAAAMIWMAATMPMNMPSLAVAMVNAVLAGYFAAVGLAWLAVVVRRGRLAPESAGNVLMSLGMAALLALRL